jgi:hypothetical protein
MPPRSTLPPNLSVLTQLRKCLLEAEPTAFIGIPLAQAASLALGWGKETVQKRLTVGGQPKGWGGITLDSVLALGRAHLASLTPAAAVAGGPAWLVSCGSAMLPALGGDDVAAIAFTSGSTGVAKGVMYKHKHFVAQVRLVDCMGGCVRSLCKRASCADRGCSTVKQALVCRCAPW